MKQTLDLVFRFGADGNDVASVSHGDDIFLQILCVGSAHVFLKRVLDLAVCHAHFSANVGQSLTCLVSDKVLGDYGS